MTFLTGNGDVYFPRTCYTHNNFQLPQAFYFPLLFIQGREVAFLYLASLWQHEHHSAGHVHAHTGTAKCK
jgi:hypothetical protein